jgi:hypothetical protein
VQADRPLAGHIVSWQRDPAGGWVAVVVLVVIADQLQPR